MSDRMTNKEKILGAIQSLSDDVTIDQAIDCLHLLQKVETGLQQVEAGQVVRHDEVMNQLLGDDAPES